MQQKLQLFILAVGLVLLGIFIGSSLNSVDRLKTIISNVRLPSNKNTTTPAAVAPSPSKNASQRPAAGVPTQVAPPSVAVNPGAAGAPVPATAATKATASPLKSKTTQKPNPGPPAPQINGKPIPSRIPKLFHHVFSSEKVYAAYKPFIDSCLRLNPDWRYYLWTEEDINKLIQVHYPQLKESFKRMTYRLARSDSSRYIVLHKFGGVYLDMDIECKQPFLPNVANYSAFTCAEPIPQTQILYNIPFSAMNGVMGSEPGHPLFKRVIDRLAKTTNFGNLLGSTGPLMLTEELRKYWNDPSTTARYNATLTPASHFVPLMDGGVNWRGRCHGLSETLLRTFFVSMGLAMENCCEWDPYTSDKQMK